MTNNIELYRMLKRIPETTEIQAKTAADSLVYADTDGVATKADFLTLKNDLITLESRLEARLTWRMVLVAGVIIGAVGLMIRF